jgi:hypothetical protein
MEHKIVKFIGNVDPFEVPERIPKEEPTGEFHSQLVKIPNIQSINTMRVLLKIMEEIRRLDDDNETI